MREEVFRSDNVIYRNEGIKLLDHFNMHIFKGETFGLFFTDNHGKNELIRLATEGGILDYGSLSFLDDMVNSFIFPAPTRTSGVTLISRDELLLDEMTVAENVFVMRKKFRKYVIQASVIRSQFDRVAEEYGIDIDGGKLVRDLSPLDRYIVRLFKAVIEGSFLIIVKDIGLNPNGPEIELFQKHIRICAELGISFLYISGDVNELAAVCDRIGVAERGRIVSIIKRNNFDEGNFRKYYFDREQVKTPIETRKHKVLEFKAPFQLGTEPAEFFVSEGECVLLWDRSDTMIESIMRILSGEEKPTGGHVWLDGMELQTYKGSAPMSIIREFPLLNDVFPDMSYLDNLCFKAGNRLTSLWRKKSIKQNIRNEYFDLIGDDIDALPPLDLSAESAYNLVYLREHIFSPRLLVLIRPFIDTDIRLKMHILSLIEKLRQSGASLLILDSSVSESSAIADRTLTIIGSRIEKEEQS